MTGGRRKGVTRGVQQGSTSDEIEYIRFDSVDCNGGTFGRLIPARHFDSFCNSGLNWFIQSWYFTSNYGTSTDSLSKYKFCNTFNFPIAETYGILSHLSNQGRVARVFTYPRLPNNVQFRNELADYIEPRLMCNKQIDTSKKEFNLTILSSFEHEFQALKRRSGDKDKGHKEF